MKELELDLSGPSSLKRSEALSSLLRLEVVDIKVVQVLISIENVPATIFDYRDRERHLEELLQSLRQPSSINSERTHVVAFRYLLGSLYANFEKFWGPTIRIITDILNHSKYKTILLDILLQHLYEVNDLIYNGLSVEESAALEQDRPDFLLHRNFIFQLLAKFPGYVEANNVRFIEEFFRFFDKEMLVSPFIERFTRSNLVDGDIEPEDQVMGETNGEKVKITSKSKGSRKRRLPESLLKKRKSRETFITAVKVIQSFEASDKIHRNIELKNLFLELLSCRDSSVQRASFNCLLIFERDSLGPFIPKIQKILSDDKVRNELTSLSLDSETEPIPDEARAKLIPIIMRIIFGKMIGKIGRKGSGKDKSEMRKTLVMRFIAGCSTKEILFFFSLLFDPIYQYIEIPYRRLRETLSMKLDIRSYVPLNKLHAMLGSLSAFITSVAHLEENSLPHVMKLIVVIIYHIVNPLEQSNVAEHLNAKKLETLKVLRREAINVLAEFFKTFEYYKFSQNELDSIFEMLIWPSCEGFVDKNHTTETPILKFIGSLSEFSAYHNLLIKRNISNQEEYLLKHLTDLYVDPKTKRPVLKFLASVFANILKPDRDIRDEEDDSDEKLPRNSPIEDKYAIVPDYDKSLFKNMDSIPQNHEMLLGSVNDIFARLKSNCQDFIKTKDSDHRIENDELTILTILSGYLKDPQQSIVGTRLLLSTLAHQKKAELILNTIKTSQALMSQVTANSDPMIVMYVSEILSFQRNIDQRRELCKFIEVLSEKDSSLCTASKVINLMNATSEEFIDSPDLVKWNEGFQMAFEYIDELDQEDMNSPETVRDSLILMLHQTGYIINSIDRYEFSIRENCSIFYEKLAKKLNLIDPSINHRLHHQIVEEIIMEKFVKKGLRSTNDQVKHTYFAIVRSLALHCHDNSSTLKELYMFCNENDDLDFWYNIRHIQLHNRSKALARLLANDAINQVSPKILSGYFLPIASGFLFSKTYKSVSSLSENSIKLMGIVCKHLNWITYESTLSFYLDMLTKANSAYQKTNIKLITEIIKNFNFDLKSCEEAMQNEEENSKLEKRMKKRRGAQEDGPQPEAITAEAPSGKRLNASTARMVYFSVTKKLIPRLNSCLHEMTRVEYEHDKNMAGYLPEKEEIKRISIAYAVVQLLNLLPGRFVLLRDQLPGLLLKLTSFLKSKNEETRKASRSTLVKVMSFVGPAYLPEMIRVLKQNLDKGFQIHVLNYTLHSVLEKIPLHYGDLDHSVHELVALSIQEIFGKPSEDKEIAQILAKTPEAKKTKSYDTLLILSSYISCDKLDHVISSIKDVLKSCNEPGKVNKLSQCLQRIFTGLSKNDRFPLDKMFMFIQRTIEDSLPKVKLSPDDEKAKSVQEVLARREDRYLISKEPPRDRVRSKISEKGNYHLIVENSLRLLLLVLENNRVIIARKSTLKEKLDGFIGVLTSCLKSPSPKCIMRSLKCLYFIAQSKTDLPTFKTKCNSIVKKVFILLNLYNGVGMVKGDNSEMIVMCFKTLTLLLLKCEQVTLSDMQTRSLISYIEQDIHDTDRQATAFATLHSLLEKGCDSLELGEVMTKVADLLVTSDDEGVRVLSLKIWKIYLLKYNLQPEVLQAHLGKFIRQIDYEHIDGRKSVLRMLNIVVTDFPESLLRGHFELLFHLLSQRIVNEDSKEVRSYVGKLLGTLIRRLPDQQTFLLNQLVFQWATHNIKELRLLGAKLLSIFIESCPQTFQNDRGKIKRVLSIVAESLELATPSNDNSSSKENLKIMDTEQDGEFEEKVNQVRLAGVLEKLNYHTLRLFQRLVDKSLVKCVEERHIGHLKRIWQSLTSALTNWHTPVVKTSCELYLVFIKETNLTEALNVAQPTSDNYLNWNAKRIVRTLADKFLQLLDRADESSELLAYVTEALILIGQIICGASSTMKFEREYLSAFKKGDVIDHLLNLEELPSNGFVQECLPYTINEAKKHLNLMWISIKVVMQARKEAALYRLDKHYRRKFVIQWIAAMSQELGQARIAPYVLLFLMTPVRELSDKNKVNSNNPSGHQEVLLLSEDLLKFLKALTGLEKFNKIYSKVQLHYTKKRVDRKKKEALIRVKDQSRGVKRKIKQRKEKDSKRKGGKRFRRDD